MSPSLAASIGASISTLLLAACASNPVTIRDVSLREVFGRTGADAYTTNVPSARTRAMIDRLGCGCGNLDAAIEALSSPLPELADADRTLALAELLYHRAETTGDPHLFLRSAITARQSVIADHIERPGILSPRRHRALEHHSRALTRFLYELAEPEPRALASRLEREFGVRIEWRGSEAWSLDDFDELLLADTMEFEGLRHRYRTHGAGVPLVAHRDGDRGAPEFLTPEAINRPVTAVLASDDRGEVLRLECPRTAELEWAPGLRVAIAADFTAPFGHLLATSALHAIEDRSFFDADADGHEGLFLLEDYDPDRTPVVMVHGLWSSPLTWRDVTNDIFGDATLHDRYQVWHVMYPTGAPLLENARFLRATVRNAVATLDPDGHHEASRGIVVVGHSMGGLLTRIALTRSGSSIWNTLFEADWNSVADELDAEQRSLAEQLYFWEPVDEISRAIFVASPHHGSEMADGWIGRLGSSMMRIPLRLLKLVDRIRGRAEVRVEVPTSVDELSMTHPVMLALGRLSIRDGVPYHSIMGDVEGGDARESWTDGVVPYVSSHLAGATSELVIPGADHNAHWTAAASAEIRRILREAP